MTGNEIIKNIMKQKRKKYKKLDDDAFNDLKEAIEETPQYQKRMKKGVDKNNSK